MDSSSNSHSGNRVFPQPIKVGVHVLSEHVFCPRSSELTRLSGDDSGGEETNLGPRLDGEDMHHWDAYRFTEYIKEQWKLVRVWLIGLAAALVLTFVVWQFVSTFMGLVVSLPAFYIVGRLWDTLRSLLIKYRAFSSLSTAPAIQIDTESTLKRALSWWSLRGDGFDCQLPAEPYRSAELGLEGRPWRTLTKGDLKIPVIRQHRGDRAWYPKHVVRIAAYCRLINHCETANAPLGVLLFDNYECVLIPNTPDAQQSLDRALQDIRHQIREQERGRTLPMWPTDNRCSGCHWGEPRLYVPGKSETVLNGNSILAMQCKADDKKIYHSSCGDHFGRVPPHADAIALKIAEKN